jgi:hypothetical protein
MRSITLLKFDNINKSIIEIARDYNSNYIKSIEFLNGIHENYYLGSDMLGNIFTCKYQNDRINNDDDDDDDRNHLEVCGEYHCDDIINCMIQGTLIGQPIDNNHHHHYHNNNNNNISSSNENNSIQQQQKINDCQRQSGMSIFHSNYISITGLPYDTSSSSSTSILYGGVNGSISTILSLDEDSYTFFLIIEKIMKQNIIISNGTLNHKDYRSFHNDLKTNDSKNILDGDLIEMILLSINYLSRNQLDMITECINNELNLIYSTKQHTSSTTAVGTATGGINIDIDINNTSITNNQSVPCCINYTANDNNTENAGTIIMNLSNNSRKFNFSTEEIIRRVEDIARLH